MYNHREAFCLMLYRCQACGVRETLWNSRDGVTPFCIPCRACGADSLSGMSHVDFHLDAVDKNYEVPVGNRYFAHMTRSRAQEIAEQKANTLVELGRIKQSDRPGIIKSIADYCFGEGVNPDLLVKY